MFGFTKGKFKDFEFQTIENTAQELKNFLFNLPQKTLHGFF